MRRRGRSPTTSTKPTFDDDNNDNEEEQAEFLDQDDQDTLVDSLAQEVAHQTQQFQNMFRMVVGFAVVVSLFYPLLCQDECSSSQYWVVKCWTHALYSALNHALVIVLVTNKQNMMPFLAAGTLVPLVVVWMLGFFSEDIDHFHIGLIIGNVVTLLGSFLLRWDAQSTRNGLVELDASKYRHKAL
jgi:hypothetical protein